MIYNFISIRPIIAKVFSDLDLQEEPHRILDMIEWAGEAIEKIGAMPSLLLKITGQDGINDVVLKDYYAKLPCDLYRLNQVLYSNVKPSCNTIWYPMRLSTGSFGAGRNDKNTIDYTYIIKPGYINTNVKEGWLKLSYHAIPTDDEGFPLIPDNAVYAEAIYWYITMKLTYPMWVKGQIRDIVYMEAKQQWAIFCKRAYGDAMMPNRDGMESIKNAWLQLVPNINAHNNVYSTIGQQEEIFNQDV